MYRQITAKILLFALNLIKILYKLFLRDELFHLEGKVYHGIPKGYNYWASPNHGIRIPSKGYNYWFPE